MTGDQEVEGLTPAGSATFFYEIFSMNILSLPLIQEEQLSVFLEKEGGQYWLTAWRTKPVQ